LIISRVKNAARAGIETIRYLRPAQTTDMTKMPANSACQRVYAIASSYGGYGALLGLIPELTPALDAALVSLVHASPAHVAAFAEYLDKHSALQVSHAVDGLPVDAGTCYLASAFETVSLDSSAEDPVFRVAPRGTAGSNHAADELMESLVDRFGARCGGIVLSGIGDDGVNGIGRIIDRGGHVIVQEPKTCLCGETAAMIASTYGLPTVLPGMQMAEVIRTTGLAEG
jgi:two-component system chemotaxis response regulator CheB